MKRIAQSVRLKENLLLAFRRAQRPCILVRAECQAQGRSGRSGGPGGPGGHWQLRARPGVRAAWRGRRGGTPQPAPGARLWIESVTTCIGGEGLMSSLNLELHDGVGHITLNRPDALNALSRQFCHEIDLALRDLDNTESVRAILISSALKHFCAGADIREMAEMTAEEAMAGQFTGCVSSLPDISKPVIVAVKGLAAGGGCELVEMCDIVIAAATAKFCHPEITLAAMPGAGGTQRLPRVVGKHLAMDLLLTGRALSADEALAAGLVSRIVPDEQLEDAALAVAKQVASFSGPVARRIKASVNDTQANLAAGLVAERERFHRCFTEHDFREGVSAFIEKRNAHFLHR